MNTLSRPKFVLSYSLLAVGAALALAAGPSRAVEGQKLDSGLGELPHYRHWVDNTGRVAVNSGTGRVAAVAVAGEKQDSGLGELPHYRHWKDKSGRDPLGRQGLQVASGKTH